jgi:hypothetical protein
MLVDQFFAAVVDAGVVLAFGHQGREVPEPLLVAVVGVVEALCPDL